MVWNPNRVLGEEYPNYRVLSPLVSCYLSRSTRINMHQGWILI